MLQGIYSTHINVRVVYSRKLVLAVTTWSNMYLELIHCHHCHYSSNNDDDDINIIICSL